MSDNYQAVYDAARSRINGCDTGQAIENAIRAAGFDHTAEMGRRYLEETEWQQQRPCVLFRPRISIDGNQWCALYGDNLQDGVAGFGDSPALAMADFDRNWNMKLADARKAATAT